VAVKLAREQIHRLAKEVRTVARRVNQRERHGRECTDASDSERDG